MEIYLAHCYYYKPFYWTEVRILLQERLIKANMGSDCFWKLHVNLAILFLFIVWKRLYFVVVLGFIFSLIFTLAMFCALGFTSVKTGGFFAFLFFFNPKVYSAPPPKPFL